ncbi:MAG: molybdopterin-binding protein [Clostridia bacterium]|nr:molybdopterin-binding protein [Clostridia bacterium]
MKLIRTEEAVGHVLCHDMTQIIPGVYKDARFRKGHIVTAEDIPVLLSMGKENLYVWEKTVGMLHEDEAALRLRDLCISDHMHCTAVKEGKVELIADKDGLFEVNTERLFAVNSQEELMIATRHTNTVVHPGDKLAGMRVIPLVIAEEKLKRAEEAAGKEPLIRITPWKLQTAAIITTGSEVAKGLIEDKFTPVVKDKLAAFGIQTISHTLSGDDRERIRDAIVKAHDEGIDLICCTGGMSVDPDDKTPGAIAESGVKIVTYGAPTLPGAMFCLGYFEDGTPVTGLPGCVMYAKATIFDLVLPRIAAGKQLTRTDFVKLGHGGLCLGCGECHYPVCPFGKEGT